MKKLPRYLAAVMVCAVPALPQLAAAQASATILPAITTPDKVDS